ncbi:MAG: hypothetical protein J1F10_07730 [Muribaculaceae bacterium]|nr:hypothetical protein [Muribaculaceae bacterium]
MKTEFILENVAQQIAIELRNKSYLTCGLLSGDFGKIIYLYEYSKINPSYAKTADELLQKLFDTYRSTQYIPTYCGGIAGFGIGLHILENSKYVSGANNYLSDIDNYLSICLQNFLTNSNLDFLHGASGLGYYFEIRARKNNKTAKECIYRYIDNLERTAIIGKTGDKEYIKWKFDNNEKSKEYNISLSHGLSSVAILLTRIYKNSNDASLNDRILKLLDGITNYLLSQRINQFYYGSFFPTFPKECAPLNKSRLAWCYGDLGISTALLHISNVTHNKCAFSTALGVAEFAAKNRLSPSKNAVYDSGICHGSSGVAQYFSRIYDLTNNPIFYNAYDFWKNITLNHCVVTDCQVNFPSYDASSKGWKNNTYILEGNAGCALMLMKSDNILNSILLYE